MIKVLLNLLVLKFPGQQRPKPSMGRQELNKVDLKLILESKREYKNSPWPKVLLANLLCIILNHLLLNGVNAHLKILLLCILILQLPGKVIDSLTDRRVKDKYLLGLNELFEEVGVVIFAVEGLQVGLVLSSVGGALDVVVEAFQGLGSYQLLGLDLGVGLARNGGLEGLLLGGLLLGGLEIGGVVVAV